MSRNFPASPQKTFGGWMLPLVGLALGSLTMSARADEKKLLADDSAVTEILLAKADKEDGKSKKDSPKKDGDRKPDAKKDDDKKPEVKKDSYNKPEPKKDGDKKPEMKKEESKKPAPPGPAAAWEQLRKRMEQQQAGSKGPGPRPGFGGMPSFGGRGFGGPGFGGPGFGGFGPGGRPSFGGFNSRFTPPSRDSFAQRGVDRDDKSDSADIRELKREIESLRRDVERLRGSIQSRPGSARGSDRAPIQRAPAPRMGPPSHGFHGHHAMPGRGHHDMRGHDAHGRPGMRDSDRGRPDGDRPGPRPEPKRDGDRRPEPRPEIRRPDGDRRPEGDRPGPRPEARREGDRPGPRPEARPEGNRRPESRPEMRREGDRQPERRTSAETAPAESMPTVDIAHPTLLESLVQESLFNGNQQRVDALILEMLTLQQ